MVKAKPVEFRNIRQLLRRVDLIDNQEKRLRNLTKKSSQFLIGSGNGSAAVEDKEDERRFLYRDLCLFENSPGDVCFRAGNHPARVYHLEGTSVPGCRALYPVACDSRLVGNNGAALADKAIEERRLADIRTADDRYQRQRAHQDSPHATLFEDSTSNDKGPEMSGIRLYWFQPDAI